MGNRYTAGDKSMDHQPFITYQILDNGVFTGAFGSASAINNIYDECEISGGLLTGAYGAYYSGTFTGGQITSTRIFGGEYTCGDIRGPCDCYLSETGVMVYG